MTVEEKLQQCINTLTTIKESGYWPFASPAPCSTEVKIKNCINSAIANLEGALAWHHEMFGKVGRNCMESGRSEIKQVK